MILNIFYLLHVCLMVIIYLQDEGRNAENDILSMEYFLTNPEPNLDLSRHVRDTLNFVSVFGLYPNIAVSDQVRLSS